MASDYSYRESKSPKSKGKKLDHISVKQAEDGGHIIEHHFAEDGMVYHKSKSYAFGKDEGEEVMQHVAKHMHVSGPTDESEEDANS